MVPVIEVHLDCLLVGVRGHEEPELHVLTGLAPVEAGLLLLLSLCLLFSI